MGSKRKIFIIILLLILIALILLFIDKCTYKEYSKNYFYMDTYINVKVTTTKGKKEMDSIFNDIDYLYSSYHKLTDRYNEYDGIVNVYYLNEVLGNDDKIVIDKRLSDIIRLGMDYYTKTDGLFNIASGNLTEVWKEFIDKCDSLPSKEELEVNIDIDDVILSGNEYMKKNGVKLDLGAISKGYVTEMVGNYLEEENIYSYIINAGGNVKVGKAYKKDYYSVGITNPDEKSDIFAIVKINNMAVVTSGNYQRYCDLEGVNYNHIINPKTRYPGGEMKSVTVVGEDSALLDIYSTYLYLLPVSKGLEIVNGNDEIEAIWYIDKDNIVRSEGFDYE